jgi:shikimate kinase
MPTTSSTSSTSSDSHVVLVGAMGSGKTTVGGELARRLGRPLVDSDEQVRRRTGRTVHDIADSDGAEALHRAEVHALRDALDRPVPSVVAAAASVVTDDRIRARLAGDDVTVIWLRASPETLATRVGEPGDRPFLGHDSLAVLRRLEAERRRLYEQVADITVDVESGDPPVLAERILERRRAS